MKNFLFTTFLTLILFSCQQENQETLFQKVIPTDSGIDFVNQLDYTEELNPYTYRNFFNGGGVALGDINNDGLLDIFFSGNIVSNKLYLNQGDWKFKDITAHAGVADSQFWSTGVTFVDINADGWLDIYVCKSGPPSDDPRRRNSLYINQKDGSFQEEAAKYNLDFSGLATQAAFFDYDKDGDLDCYLLTNSFKSVGIGQEIIRGQREVPSEDNAGNKLLRNDNGQFIDVTLEAGIFTSDIGFGLGITLADYNQDNWPDIFISNDFYEKDYLYINDQDGTFSEESESYFESLSMGSMGADASDLNNDGLPEIMVTEMLPSTLSRKKTKATYESWDKYSLNTSKGYYHQFPRNVLQRNVGNGQFLEIGRLAGVAATEWSWGTLIFDANNDGLNDIFVSNGIYKDLLDRDYLNYMANEEQIRSMIENEEDVITKLIDVMPSKAVVNQLFQNKGNFEFESISESAGLEEPTFSNGSAYGDLDNDGDLDLVINNVNMPAFVYQNNTDSSTNHSLRFKLSSEDTGNTFAIGTMIKAWANNMQFSVSNFPSKGFQSSVDPKVHLGLGSIEEVDSIQIIWPNGTTTRLENIKTNQLVSLEEPEKSELNMEKVPFKNRFLTQTDPVIDYVHDENLFVDFDRERLLTEMYQNEGPAMAQVDLNGDRIEDFYLGGSRDQAGQIFLSNGSGYESIEQSNFELDKISEDIDAVFFDADQDNDMDLYVVSGGRSYSRSSSALMDRLYLNDGSNNFSKSTLNLPFTNYHSNGTVSAADYDKDGDQDLFIGERFDAFTYGTGGRGFLFKNNGQGQFTDATSETPAFLELGMITDSQWSDIDKDGDMDLVVSTDWSSVHLFVNENGSLIKSDQIEKIRGWWKKILVEDIDNDGDLDIVVGNHGENSFFQSKTRMYISDFDQNGTKEQIICENIDGKYYPIIDKDELIKQLPSLKKQLVYFEDYADKTINELFPKEVLDQAIVFEVDERRSGIFYNEKGKFSFKELPKEAQYGPVYAIETDDIDGDGFTDLILGGNQYLVKPQFGRYDALKGLILFGSETGFNSQKLEFLNIDGQIRQIKKLTIKDAKKYLFIINNGSLLTYEKEN